MPIRKLLQFPFDDRLSHPVCNCRDTQKSFASIIFWYFRLPYCLGKIATACKPVPYRVKVLPWFARYGFDGHTINTGTFSIRSHFFESFPDLPSLDRLCLLLLVKNHS